MTRISPFVRDMLDFEPSPALAKSIAETQADIRAAFRRRLAKDCLKPCLPTEQKAAPK